MQNQIARRNLTPTQRAALAVDFDRQLAKAAKERQKKRSKNKASEGREKIPYLQDEEEDGRARDKAAKAYGASPRYVSDAKQIE